MTDTQRLVIPALGGLYRALAPVTEPLIRVVSGLSLAAHGYAILFGNHEAFAAFFERAGFRPGLFWAIVNGLVQFAGGLCFAFGFPTRLVAVPILIFLVTALTYHWQFGFYWDIRGFEYPLFWSVVTFHFLVRGGGPWSLDALIGREVWNMTRQRLRVSTGDMAEKKVSFDQIGSRALRLHRRGRSELRHHRRRRRRHGDRCAGDAGDGGRRDRARARRHRQADQICAADPLSRGARARRIGLQGRRDSGLRYDARPDRRARQAGHGCPRSAASRACSAPWNRFPA